MVKWGTRGRPKKLAPHNKRIVILVDDLHYQKWKEFLNDIGSNFESMQDVLLFLLDSSEKIFTVVDPTKSKKKLVTKEEEVIEATKRVLREGYGNIFIQWDDEEKNYLIQYGKKVRFG
jgi:uncharacterized damage-inducible protein DinB